MKTIVALPKALVSAALTTHMNTIIRKKSKEANLLVVEILENEIGQFQTAINTITEGK